MEEEGGDFGGRSRSVGRGMWDGKGGGWCGWGVDYLTISTRPRNKKKGRWRGGRTARRRVAGEEAELPVSSSEGLNLESKEEKWKCGFW